MQTSLRRRHLAALQDGTFTSRSGTSQVNSGVKPPFHLDLWIGFTLRNCLLDVGQPVVMLLLPRQFPLNRAGPAEYLHMVSNVITPFLLLKLTERSPRALPPPAVYLCIISVVMGTSLHLVGSSVSQRLLLIGYQFHLSFREDPIIGKLEPAPLMDSLELLLFFDKTLGRSLWCVPFFLVLFLYFGGCFSRSEVKTPLAAWFLLPPGALHYWFLITDGQIFIIFIFTFFAMMATVMRQRRRGLVPDANGNFLLYSFSAALLLVVFWVVFLWNDNVLRRRHSGLIYIPEPWSVYTLHLHLDHNHTACQQTL